MFLNFCFFHNICLPIPKINSETFCVLSTFIQEALQSKINPRRLSSNGTTTTTSNSEINYDDDEIVVLSDTVRQRRSRTPSSNAEPNPTSDLNNVPHVTNTGCPKTNGSTLPDLLPDTFRLAETSTLFSKVSDPVFQMPQVAQRSTDDPLTDAHPHRVEVRESDLSTTKHVSMMPTGLYMSANVNTISILESVDTFEPEFVEMVHIIDASEDDEIDEGIVRSDSQQYAVKERDLLRDSEEPNKKRRSLIPNLKEILCASMGRDSFSEIDDDEQRYSRGSDSSDMVGFVYFYRLQDFGVGRTRLFLFCPKYIIFSLQNKFSSSIYKYLIIKKSELRD